MTAVAALMASPSTHFEPADPRPLRTVVVGQEEFNYLATHHRKPIEINESTAVLVVGPVMYVTSLSEPTC